MEWERQWVGPLDKLPSLLGDEIQADCRWRCLAPWTSCSTRRKAAGAIEVTRDGDWGFIARLNTGERFPVSRRARMADRPATSRQNSASKIESFHERAVSAREPPTRKCRMTEEEACRCPCHRAIGVLVALFGLNFLLKALGVYGDNVSNIVWPVLLMLGGIKHTFRGKCKCCSDKEASGCGSGSTP